MLSTTPYSASTAGQMQNAISKITADESSSPGNVALLQQDLDAYYQVQEGVRGYAALAISIVNGSDYNGISVADNSGTYMNTGVADAANPNSVSEYYVPPSQRIMLGSAFTVLTNLYYGSSTTTLLSLLPASVRRDIDNIYIHVFQRNDKWSRPDRPIAGLGAPRVGDHPDLDPVLFTERGYLLAPTSGAPEGSSNFTGAAVQFLQSPYIVCDTVATNCGGTQ
jgi:hypothetical protein